MAEFKGHMAEKLPAQAVKLDVKDRKILFELSKNARYSAARLGKMTGMSREVVKYRIKALIDSKVLTGFITLVDAAKLGYLGYLVYINVHNITKNKEQWILNFLIKNEITVWVASCGGSYNFSFSVLCKSKDTFDNLFAELKDKCGKHLKKYIILEGIKEGYLPQYHLLEGIKYSYDKKYTKNDGSFDKLLKQDKHEKTVSISSTASENIALGKTAGKTKIDEKDIELLKILLADSRIPILELSRKLELATTSVTRRIEKLIQLGIILGFMPLISLHLLGFEWYMTFLSLHDTSTTEKRERELLSYLYHHAYVLWYVKCIGEYNLQLSIFSKDSAHYKQIISDIKEKFSDIITSSDFVVIFNQHKFVYGV